MAQATARKRLPVASDPTSSQAQGAAPLTTLLSFREPFCGPGTYHFFCLITLWQALHFVQKTLRSERLSCPRTHSQSVAAQDSSQYLSSDSEEPTSWKMPLSVGTSARPELGAGQAPLVMSPSLLRAAEPRQPVESQGNLPGNGRSRTQLSWESNHGSTHSQLQNSPNFNTMAPRGQLGAVVSLGCYRHLCLQSWGPEAPSDQAVRSQRTLTQYSRG